MSTLPPIRTAETHEAARVSEILTEAFQDAVTLWLIPDPGPRSEITRKAFGLFVEQAMASGVVEIIGDYEGAAVWFDMTRTDQEPSPPDPRVAQAYGPYADRWNILAQLTDDVHPKAAHHYLMLLGVRPDRQGKGLGRALLEHHHESVTGPAGIPAYLEAAGTDSRRLYRRLGYQDLDPLPLPDGPSLYPMWWPAPAAGELPDIG